MGLCINITKERGFTIINTDTNEHIHVGVEKRANGEIRLNVEAPQTYGIYRDKILGKIESEQYGTEILSKKRG